MEEIRSISEAFSNEPGTLTVRDKPSDNQLIMSIKKIICKTRHLGTNRMISVYVGYDFKDKKLFEYIASSVNVHYK